MAFVIGSHYCPVEIARTKSWGIWVIYVGQVRSGVACEFQFSLSLFPGFGNLLRQNFRFPFPIEKHLSTLSYPCLRVFRTYIRFMKTENKGYAKLYIRIYIYMSIRILMDFGWKRMDRWNGRQRGNTFQDYQ